MNPTFATIGLEVPSETAFNSLAARAGDCGEASLLARRGMVWHGRCWKLGEGLEVWTVLYEAESGETFYADCRPGFRARHAQYIGPWALTEYDQEGEAVIHGYCQGSQAEVLFELQNMTEMSLDIFRGPTLCVGLCGLAYRAHVAPRPSGLMWQPLARTQENARENDWRLCGRVLDFKTLRNPLSGSDLCWIYVDTGKLRLEVLVNHNALRGTLRAGAVLTAQVWLQGHVFDAGALRARYEGHDYTVPVVSYWRHLRRLN
jgi:hypothetical protein